MARVSNWVITVLNILTLLLACSSIYLAFKFHRNEESTCANSLKVPLLVLGGVLMVVSFMGIVGACCRVTFFMYIYLFTLIVIMIGLLCYTFYMIVVASNALPVFFSFGNNAWEQKIRNFSSSVAKFGMPGNDSWNKFRNCFDAVKLCKGFEDGKDEQYYKNHMTPLQWGCCTPPKNCGFKLQNATYWVVPESSPALTDRDCQKWSNTQSQLCYDCETCKASLIDDMRKQWKYMGFVNFFVIIFVNIVLSTACCAHDNNKEQRYKKYRGGGYYP